MCARRAGWHPRRRECNTDWLCQVSTGDQDLTSQRDALLRLGVLDSNSYVDHGLTGANRARPGLREALAAVREGDTFVVTKLDRLARSVKDARDIADELTTRGVASSCSTCKIAARCREAPADRCDAPVRGRIRRVRRQRVPDRVRGR